MVTKLALRLLTRNTYIYIYRYVSTFVFWSLFPELVNFTMITDENCIENQRGSATTERHLPRTLVWLPTPSRSDDLSRKTQTDRP